MDMEHVKRSRVQKIKQKEKNRKFTGQIQKPHGDSAKLT